MDPLAPDFANTPVSGQRPRFHYVAQDRSSSPAVSIITPYYNTGSIFLETAQSIMQQSLQQWEWLIINDGSDDHHALSILDDFRDLDDPRIHVVDLKKNQGLPAARNAGLRHASSDLLFFLDADDLIEPTALEKMAWCLESYPEFEFCKGFTIGFGASEYRSRVGFEASDLFLQRNPITPRFIARRDAVLSVNGFDESLVHGLEDWDFWLRSASQGFWGYTIPEYLDWFRRREDHSDRWSAWTDRGVKEMRRRLQERYPEVYANGMPRTQPEPMKPFDEVSGRVPFANRLARQGERLLLIIPWMAMGGADKFNLDLISQLKERGYEVSVATTLPDNYGWYGEFQDRTPDLFVLPNFLKMNDYPRFLHYLIKSRQIDVVFVSNSELGYKFLPYLRSRCPETAFVDYCHMEKEHWNNGGFPRLSIGYQEALDLSMVTSDHLKHWMVQRGKDPQQVEVAYVNVDTQAFSPDLETRRELRAELNIDPEKPVILYAGRLCSQKQPEVFGRVMKELKERDVEFLCLVAGDGPDREWLSSYLRKHRLRGRVWVVGAVSNTRVRELLSVSDLFFLPSKAEGIAVTIYEAMATEVVPVGADVGGQRELVTPACGVLIQRDGSQGEVEAYADALQRLIESPDLRNKMGRAARSRVCTQFDLSSMGERVEILLERARQRRRSRVDPEINPGLAVEHAVQAVEHERVLLATQGLDKYRRVESLRLRVIRFYEARKQSLRRFLAPVERVMRRLKLARRTMQALRKVKDAIWIVGHRWKVRLLDLEESD
jgi:glycosyltransferase involved in cell wall biosynthesis